MGRFGCIPSVPDHRDMRLSFSHESVAALPPKNAKFTNNTIRDQGNIGSCTAHGILACAEHVVRKKGLSPQDLSRLQLYFDEREIEGTIQSDAGAQIRNGIKTFVKKGVGLESLWGYDTHRFMERPPQAVYDSALDHQALKYASVQDQQGHVTINQVKSVLMTGNPVAIGFSVFESIDNPSVATTGVVPIPTRFESQVGGHCVMLNGFFDDALELVGFDNSWSERWGQKGSGFLPYWFFNMGLVSDGWTIYDVETANLPEPQPVQPVHGPLSAMVGTTLQLAAAMAGGRLNQPAKPGDWASIGP